MSKWFIIVLAIIFLTSVVAIFVRVEDRREANKLEEGDFSADDFDIVE